MGALWWALALAVGTVACASARPNALGPKPDPTAIGTEAPVRVIAVAPGGEWVVIEQAREDTNADGKLTLGCDQFNAASSDASADYLIHGAGPGAPISEFITSDRDGRWLVITKNGDLVLVNAATREWTVLPGAEIESNESCARGASRVAQFDAEGRTLLYLKRSKEKSKAVLRTLATGSEKVISLGPGKLWRADLSANGDVVTAYFVRGSLAKGPEGGPNPPDYQFLKGLWAYGTCSWRCMRSPLAVSWGPHREELDVRVARAGDDEAKDVPGFITSLGSDYVGDTPDGALVLQKKDERVELLPAGCDPRVWLLHDRLGLIVATCGGDEQQRGMFLLGRGVHVELAPSGMFDEGHKQSPMAPEIVSDRFAMAGRVLVDFERRGPASRDVVRTGDEVSPARRDHDETRDGRKLIPARRGDPSASADCSELGPLYWGPPRQR